MLEGFGRGRARGWLLCLGWGLLAACGEDAKGDAATTDTDGDGISDLFEGRDERVNTDGDSLLDYEDPDSDADGLKDSLEGGNGGDLSMRPRDSDSDGVPNFQDRDSDGNGIDDSEEPTEDYDGDGLGDWEDPDDDDDLVSDATEFMGVYDPPLDGDGDGIPNYLDPDSDNDFILDGHERFDDSDEDGILNWDDPDSDNDGIPDAVEAGDEDIRTTPVDTDGDRVEDFLDLDADNDGVSDAVEVESGTSPILGDSDGDTVSDLIEIAAGTDALSDDDSPRTRGDFVFVVPFESDPLPKDDTLRFKTDITFADVYILMDLSGSMGGELEGVRMALADAVTTLTCEDFSTACKGDTQCAAGQICGTGGTCIENPKTTSCIESVWTGFGAYGDPGEYVNEVSLQPDPAVTIASLPQSTTSAFDEALHEAAICVADPIQCDEVDSCAAQGVGCPGFREDATRILVGVTDEADRCYGGGCSGPGVDDVTAALTGVGVNFVGINSGTEEDTDVIMNLSALAEGTNTVGLGGEPLVYTGANAAVTDALVDAINGIIRDVPIRVTLTALETQDDAGNALPFVERLSVNTSGGDCTAVTNLEDTDDDGFDDTFGAVKPGTSVCWDIAVATNTTVPPLLEPQVFRLRLVVRGNGAVVDERTAYFLVPPMIPELVGPQ